MRVRAGVREGTGMDGNFRANAPTEWVYYIVQKPEEREGRRQFLFLKENATII